jgi:integrase
MMVINKLERKGEYILDVDYPVKMWKQLAKKIDRPELRLHDLRHNFCTMAGEIMELPELMKLSGHKSMSAVLRYRKVREPRAIKEMQNVGDYMTKIMMSN